MFLRNNHWKFWTISILQLWNKFSVKRKPKQEYHFLVESTKIENATFPSKTALSETNVKTNRIWSTKLTYHNKQICSSNYIFFCENFVSVYETRIKSWFDVPTTQTSMFILFESVGDLFEGAFIFFSHKSCQE